MDLAGRLLRHRLFCFFISINVDLAQSGQNLRCRLSAPLPLCLVRIGSIARLCFKALLCLLLNLSFFGRLRFLRRRCLIVGAGLWHGLEFDKATGGHGLVALTTANHSLIALHDVRDSELSCRVVFQVELDRFLGAVDRYAPITSLLLLDNVIFGCNRLNVLVLHRVS